jgi:SPP1 gp7 family putative phage head morphogenesis protein
VFNKSEVRRRTIARTESLRALNGGRFEQMKVAGIAQKEWLTVGDGAVRESHEFLDGKVVPIGDAFETIGNNEIMYPLDPAADAGETINCRCTVLAVFEGSNIGANEPDEE